MELILYLLIFGIILYITIFIFIQITNNSFRFNDINDIDYIMILGCRVNEDGSGSNALISRLDVAIKIALKTDVELIVSGGQGIDEPICEAEFMKNYLISKGINENKIILENKSTSTFENLNYSKKLININNVVLIVTNDFHVLRTYMLAKRLGLNFFIEPSYSKFSTNSFREVFALIKSIIFDRVK